MKVKSILRPVLILLGIAITLNGVVLFMIANFNLGNLLTLLLGVILTAGVIFFEKIPKYIKLTVAIPLTVAVALSSFLAIYGVSDNVTYKEDALVVLGAGINGKRITYVLADRLDRAVEYSRENPDALIVVSGGQGPGEDISEADAMYGYLTSKGVPEDRIIKEDKSTSTYENFKFSKAIMDEILGKDYKVAYVTNEYHIYRAGGIARNAGLSTPRHLHSTTRWYSVLPGLLRECLAVMKFWVFGN